MERAAEVLHKRESRPLNRGIRKAILLIQHGVKSFFRTSFVKRGTIGGYVREKNIDKIYPSFVRARVGNIACIVANPVSKSLAMDSTGMSFEAKIAMALGGSSWQSLQSTTTVQPSPAMENAAGEEEDEYDIDEEDDEDGDDGVPLEMEDAELDVTQEVVVDEATLQKRKKKLERFEKSVARDAGEVLETITTDALAPVPQTVAWDQDPELLCCYNWQSSTDGTNTIFGTYLILHISGIRPSSSHSLQSQVSQQNGANRLSLTLWKETAVSSTQTTTTRANRGIPILPCSTHLLS